VEGSVSRKESRVKMQEFAQNSLTLSSAPQGIQKFRIREFEIRDRGLEHLAERKTA
jgi:hypothetical protein